MNDQRAPDSRHARFGVLAVIAVLLASAAIGFIAYRLVVPPLRETVHAAPIPAHPATAAPDAEAVAGAASTALKVPEHLPDIRLPGTDGAVHGLGDFRGRPLVVNFWATWCEPCRREIPLLKTLRRERAADGLEIVGIAVDYRDAVRKYAADHGIDYPVLVGDRGGLAAVSAFGMETVLPFSVFADREGSIVTLKVGELHRDEAELILDRVRDVDGGKLTLPTAREQISEGVRRLRTAQSDAG
ncbi:MAG TPA: TlpA disulfide reductase family protein [Steroidobacteraceae bacterium]|nr:TlpA disulfide reductase family protein [Steroidobacteraceae bacterium]